MEGLTKLKSMAIERCNEYIKDDIIYHEGVECVVFSDAEECYILGYKDAIKQACQWLKDRVEIPYNLETDENGVPYADSYTDYLSKRLNQANIIIEEFKKAMEG